MDRFANFLRFGKTSFPDDGNAHRPHEPFDQIQVRPFGFGRVRRVSGHRGGDDVCAAPLGANGFLHIGNVRHHRNAEIVSDRSDQFAQFVLLPSRFERRVQCDDVRPGFRELAGAGEIGRNDLDAALVGLFVNPDHRQWNRFLDFANIIRSVRAYTAGAAHLIAERGGVEDAAIASALAAETYGLEILRRNVEDAAHNTTRFYVCALKPQMPPADAPDCVTTIVFRVRNLPAALYKALGGFATNGVNMTKLESYMLDGEFTATQFLADVDGHPDQPPVRRALEELDYFSREMRVLGTYRAHPYRREHQGQG